MKIRIKDGIVQGYVCPFCGGKVSYYKKDVNTRSPESIQCLGDCYFEMQGSYVDPDMTVLRFFVNGAKKSEI